MLNSKRKTTVIGDWVLVHQQDEIKVVAPGGKPGFMHVKASDRALSARLLYALADAVIRDRQEKIAADEINNLVDKLVQVGEQVMPTKRPKKNQLN